MPKLVTLHDKITYLNYVNKTHHFYADQKRSSIGHAVHMVYMNFPYESMRVNESLP